LHPELSPVTLIIKHDLHGVKINQQANYLGRRLFSSHAVIWTYMNT